MDEKVSSVLSAAVLPGLIDLIVTNERIDEIAATKKLYASKTYELLAREETKLWHLSPAALYEVLKSEEKTGEPILPEEN